MAVTSNEIKRFLNSKSLSLSLSSYNLTKLRFHSIRRFKSGRKEGMTRDFKYAYLECWGGEQHPTLRKKEK